MPADAPLPSATWTPDIVTRAKYEVFARWQEANGRATNAPFTIHHEGGSTTVLKNQEQNGNTWMSLGTYVLAPGQNHRVVLGDVANGYVTADVMKFVPVDEAWVAWPIASIPANGNYKVYAKWPASPANASDATYTVTHAGGSTQVVVNQTANGGQWNLLGTFAFDAGTPGYQVALSAAGDGQVAADAIYYANDNAVPDSFTWTPTLPLAGDYAVYAKWPAGAADSGTAVYTITHDGGVASHSVSQRANGGEWVWLGTYAMDPANNPQVTLTAANDGAVYADAVRFVSGDAIGGDIAYSHGDQLGTIQKLTDGSGALVWDRIARPFGETVSINAASGLEQKLRFPGQYADETGLSYNRFRDCDPTVGRFLESDPIGLDAGVNTYAYALENPVRYSDPLGLLVPEPKPGGGAGDDCEACQKAFRRCYDTAIELHDRGDVPGSRWRQRECERSRRLCIHHELNVQTNPAVRMGITKFPPDPENNGGGYVLHEKGMPAQAFPPDPNDPIFRILNEFPPGPGSLPPDEQVAGLR